MRKLFYSAFIAAVVLSLGCAITNYPVMFDSFGAYEDAVVDSNYDKAYIIPTDTVATIWGDGSDELYTLVVQTWQGDQDLKTYSNYDPSGVINFLDQTYCDPTRQSDCAIVVANNPNLPDAYPFSSSPINPSDNVFDNTIDASCQGARSLSILIDYGSTRIGECGSFFRQDAQNLANEFGNLAISEWRGKAVYEVPINGATAEFNITDANSNSTRVPIFGSYNAFMDEKQRAIVEFTPNVNYQRRWLSNYVAEHGNYMAVEVIYGSVVGNFSLSAQPVSDL